MGMENNKEKRWWFKKAGPAQAPVADQGRKGPRPPHLEGRGPFGLSAISPHQTGQQ